MKANSLSRLGRLPELKSLSLTALALAAIWRVEPACATTRNWTGDVNNKWSEPNNWNPAGTPQNGDSLIFETGSNSDMANDLTGLSVRSLEFDDASVPVVSSSDYSVSGNLLTITGSGDTGFISVGSANLHSRTVTFTCDLKLGIDLEVDVFAGDNIVTGDPNELDLQGSIDLNGHEMFLQEWIASDGTYPKIVVSGQVIGTGSIKASAPQDSVIEFNGPLGNTFQGPLKLLAYGNGDIYLNKQTGVVVNDELLVLNGNIQLRRPAQIGLSATVALTQGSRLQLSGYNYTFGTLLITNIHADATATILDTGNYTVTLANGITSWDDNIAVMPTIKGRLALPSGMHDVSVLGFNYAGLDIQGEITGSGGLSKIGNTALILEGSNTLSGPIVVTQGILDVRNNNALGNSSGVTLGLSGSLTLRNASPAGRTLFVQGNQQLFPETAGSLLFTVGTCVWGGPIVLQTNLVVFADNTYFTGPISGSGGLDVRGFYLDIAGPDANTFTGTLRGACGLLELAKSSGTAFKGPLVAGLGSNGGTLETRWSYNSQNPNAAVSLLSDGLVNLNNHNETFSSVTFNGGDIETGAGLLTLAGPISGLASSSTALLDGRLLLATDLTANIADGAANPDLAINATISDASSAAILKQGAGELSLGGANTYHGATTVQAGVLQVVNDQALGSTTFGTTVNSNASVEVYGLSPAFSELLNIVGPGRGGTNGALACRNASSISSLILLNGPSTISNFDTNSQFLLLNRVFGTGPLTKSGPGILNLGGTLSDTYSGDTLVSAGPLWLSKSANVIAIPGNLIIGPSASAVLFQGSPMGGDTVTVNANSLLDLNNYNMILTHLNLNDGGSVRTGAGQLNISGGGVVAVGSQSFLGSRASASISGRLGLPGNDYVSFDVGRYNQIFVPPTAPELDVPAVVSDLSTAFGHGLFKNGSGQMRLGGNNGLTGEVDVNDGVLILSNSLALGRVASATFVQTNGTLALDGGITITNKGLYLASASFPALDGRSGSNTWSGLIVLSRDTGVNVSPANGYLQALNTVSGPGGLIKLGPGTLQFRGSTSNTYSGLTVVSNGVVEAGRTNVISIPGDVAIGDDSGTNITATLRSIRDTQLRPTANVDIRGSGLLDLVHSNNIPAPNERLRTLTGHGQVHVDFLCALSISNDVPFDFYGAVSASQAQVFNKYGAAMMRVWGNWDFPNGIVINRGDFWLNGTVQGVDVQSGARLRGDGHVTSGAAIEPGGFLGADSMVAGHQGGDLDIADLELNAGATVELDLFGPTPTGGNDRFNVQSAFLRSASLSVAFNYPPRDGDVITLINKTSSGPISGTFTGWPIGQRTVGTVPVLVNYAGGDGNDLTLTVTNLALGYVGYRLAEGNGNQTVEANECNLLYLTLVNRRTGSLTITNTVLRTTSGAGALVTIPQATFPVLPAGQSRESLTAFQFRTDTNLACGSPVSFELVVGVLGEGQFAIAFTPVPGSDCTHPTGPCESCTVAYGQFSPNTPTVGQPLYFVGGPSLCYPAKACPGLDPGANLPPTRYLTHSFTNSTTNALCVTAQLDFDCAGAPLNALGAAAYLGNFDPNQACAGYLGDLGLGGPPYSSFSFLVPAHSNFVIVVMARAASLPCNNYTLELFGLPCPQPILAISPDNGPNKVRVHWSTAYPGFTAQQLGKLGGSFTNSPLTPYIVDGRYALTNITATSNQFYRLKK